MQGAGVPEYRPNHFRFILKGGSKHVKRSEAEEEVEPLVEYLKKR